MSELDKIAENLATMAIDLGLNIEQIKECLKEASVQEDGKSFVMDEEGQKDPDVNYNDDERKEDDPVVSDLTLQQPEAQQVMDGNLLDFSEFNDGINNNNLPTTISNNNQFADDGFLSFGKTAFGKKILSKATESVRQIGKKKGIYIVGRKGKKFLGIRFTSKGNYSKNKKGIPNGKMYTLDGLRKMKNKRVSFKKLPQLIDMMDTSAVLKKHKDFHFGFELKKNRCSGFGYIFPVGAGYGRRSALLYSKL